MQSPKYTQHFLKDHSVIRQMINQAHIHKKDMVIDIGAGKGALTTPLSRKAERVIAVELDNRLAGYLKKIHDHNPDVKVLHINFLDMPLPGNTFKVVGNIPYNITTDIFGKLMDVPKTSFIKGTIITELGAAKRFTKQTTDPRIIGWNTWFRINIVRSIAPRSFSPAPSVQSAMIKIERWQKPVVNPKNYYGYMAFVTSFLEHPRVRLKDAFKQFFSWNQIKRICGDAGMNINRPIGSLTISQWAHCYNTMLKLLPKHIHPVMPGKFKKLYKR